MPKTPETLINLALSLYLCIRIGFPAQVSMYLEGEIETSDRGEEQRSDSRRSGLSCEKLESLAKDPDSLLVDG
jgi:hypothetical protein